MRSVDRQVADYYQAQELPEDRIADLLRIAERGRQLRRRRRWIAVAALLVLALGGIVLHTLLAERQLAHRVTAEVALNHGKALKVEFPAGSYADLSGTLDKLPFRLEAPRAVQLEGYQLLGGRYCSIQAQMAAQLKLLDPETQKKATLYVAALTPELESLPGVHRSEGEIEVEIWRQDGLLFALAR